METAVGGQPAFAGSSQGLRGFSLGAEHRSAVSRLPLTLERNSRYELLVVGRPGISGVETRFVRFDFASAFLSAYRSGDTELFSRLTGRFAIALRNLELPSLTLVTDRFATVPVYHASYGAEYVFAESASLLPPELRSADRLSAQAIYNYLYFHAIPSPDCIYKGVAKLPPATCLRVGPKSREQHAYWMPEFREKAPASFAAQAAELKGHCRDAIGHYADRGNVGCFLSGGLDSSTVLGYLSQTRGTEAQAFCIGFSAPEYDETEFARIAAAHFSARLHEYRVTPTDTVDAIKDIASTYDEPFGNSSAVPTLFCARLARSHGIDTMLAGDGGDELFAGNERYVKQKVFEAYFSLPKFLRSGLLDDLATADAPFMRLPGFSKVASYIRQANVRLPDRLQTYNHLEWYGNRTVFDKAFLHDIDEAVPLELLRTRYREPDDASALNRMLYVDWKFTLADNDLRKVTRMCELAEIDVEFPLLSEELVEFSTRVPSSRKLADIRLRHFYRKAMRDFLPKPVLRKRKHGFGLPFGEWVVADPILRDYSYRVLSRLPERGIFAPEFISMLKAATERQHAAYFGSMIWVIMMLEEWLSANH